MLEAKSAKPPGSTPRVGAEASALTWMGLGWENLKGGSGRGVADAALEALTVRRENSEGIDLSCIPMCGRATPRDPNFIAPFPSRAFPPLHVPAQAPGRVVRA